MEPRKLQVFRAIIESFISTAKPVGSKTIIVEYKFNVSPATIRNDMASLEDEGYIFQPHTSAGRVPTEKGYRLYLDKNDPSLQVRQQAIQYLAELKKIHYLEKHKEQLYDAVSLISRSVNNLAFATLPNNNHTFYLGLAQTLKQPEFANEPRQASQVVEVLEEGDHFVSTLKSLDINEDIRVFIGRENIIKEIESCSLIVTKYRLEGFSGYLGILGPMRMNYPFNMVIVEEVKKLLESN